jgi:hypothetical protein
MNQTPTMNQAPTQDESSPYKGLASIEKDGKL